MPFPAPHHLLLPAAACVAFRLLPGRARVPGLLAASLLFYAGLGEPHLLVALAAVTLASFGAGLGLAREEASPRSRALFLWGGIAADVGILAFFKVLAATRHPLLVTVGISFFALQAVSYLVDVYLGTAEAERDLPRFALYLAFFPKLLQGPFERAADLLPQLSQPAPFDRSEARAALLLLAWGLFKKAVVADRLALFVDPVYADVRTWAGLPFLLATYLYALQLYCDFSGYTDMALGAARLLGIRLTPNFDRPYLATSVADFWRRWHISFSRWLLDYLFKPLQIVFRDLGRSGTALALLLTFFLSGIWHGATAGFVAWGLLHGTCLAASVWYAPVKRRLEKRHPAWAKGSFRKATQRVLTFHVVCLGWVLFRAERIGDAGYALAHLFRLPDGPLLPAGAGRHELSVAALALAAGAAVHFGRRGADFGAALLARPAWVRWPAYHALAASLLLFRVDAAAGFIYFRF